MHKPKSGLSPNTVKVQFCADGQLRIANYSQAVVRIATGRRADDETVLPPGRWMACTTAERGIQTGVLAMDDPAARYHQNAG